MLQNENHRKFFTTTNSFEILEPSDKTPNDFIFKEIFEYQIYNNIPEMKIKKNDIVVDIGAHIGIFSRYSALQGAARNIAMEMEPKFFACLKLNVRPEDDVFNCIVLDKSFSKFRLQDETVVNGFTLDYFFEGGLFEKIDFLKIDVSGKEHQLVKSFSQDLCNIISKISMRAYDLSVDDKHSILNLMRSRGFFHFFNIIIPNQPIQFLYCWK